MVGVSPTTNFICGQRFEWPGPGTILVPHACVGEGDWEFSGLH